MQRAGRCRTYSVGTAWVLLAERRLAEGEQSFSLEEGVGPVGVRVDQQPEGDLLLQASS